MLCEGLVRQDKVQYDQYTGKLLDLDPVETARRKEVDQMLKYAVFEWVPAESAEERPIRTTWLDHLKAPGLVRSSCVGVQLKMWMNREDC